MKSAQVVPKIRILIGAVVAIGPGKADLLAAIARTGSISAAAREMKMSYRRAWLLVEAMNAAFRRPLVETLTGGRSGGGARVTRLGEEVLRRYRLMEGKASRAVAPDLKHLSRLIPARRGR
jgi:molybdate transport system regulatory protein